jgi:gamma-glutamyl phosphate reductase
MNDTELLKKIDAAAQAANKTEQIVADAQADRLNKCKALGSLLIEAKKRHPKVADFEAFLKGAKHVKLSAAYDYMKLVGGRKTDEEIRKAERERREATRERVKKQRANKKLPRPPSVTRSVAAPAFCG